MNSGNYEYSLTFKYKMRRISNHEEKESEVSDE